MKTNNNKAMTPGSGRIRNWTLDEDVEMKSGERIPIIVQNLDAFRLPPPLALPRPGFPSATIIKGNLPARQIELERAELGTRCRSIEESD